MQSTTKKPLISLKNINVAFQDGSELLKVLSDVTVEFLDSSLVAITGPSGAGKSTFISIIGGLKSPDSGEIYFKESQPLHNAKSKEFDLFRRKEAGFIFQNSNLLPSLNVYDQLSITCKIKNVPVDKDCIFKLLSLVKMDTKSTLYPSQLSGGEKQRVAIARGLVGESKILLVDEPTSALDEINTENIIKVFKEFAQENGSLILAVSHDDKLINNCEIVYRLEKGKLLEI